MVLVEAQRVGWGASGRNGGGVRAQWSTPTNIELAKESLELCSSFAQELGINVWFRRGGYLFLARQPKAARLQPRLSLTPLPRLKQSRQRLPMSCWCRTP